MEKKSAPIGARWLVLLFAFPLVAVIGGALFSMTVTSGETIATLRIDVLEEDRVRLDGELLDAPLLPARLCAVGASDAIVEIHARANDHHGVLPAITAALGCGAREVQFIRDARID